MDTLQSDLTAIKNIQDVQKKIDLMRQLDDIIHRKDAFYKFYKFINSDDAEIILQIVSDDSKSAEFAEKYLQNRKQDIVIGSMGLTALAAFLVSIAIFFGVSLTRTEVFLYDHVSYGFVTTFNALRATIAGPMLCGLIILSVIIARCVAINFFLNAKKLKDLDEAVMLGKEKQNDLETDFSASPSEVCSHFPTFDVLPIDL